MDEDLSVRDVEAHQIIEESAMIDHLVQIFRANPFVETARHRVPAHVTFDGNRRVRALTR